ncbi:MAG: hypothetical protein GF355_10995, partial [Candidatus Eisenbacteria bacterium]|nr:hypothetical protein [Candidatus Eisenbacteria bacterium]
MSGPEKRLRPYGGPPLGPDLGGAVRTGGANPSGAEGAEIPFPAESTGKPVALSAERLEELERLAARYPRREAALLPALWMAQEELGFISKEALEYVADLVGVPYSKAYSVVSFYTMFRPRPVGRYVI